SKPPSLLHSTSRWLRATTLTGSSCRTRSPRSTCRIPSMPAAGGGPARCWLRTASRRASPRLSTRSSATAPFSRTQVPNGRRFRPSAASSATLPRSVRYGIVHFVVRGEVREQAILAAVIELLGEAGYEAMTMDAIAARAHASKTTIYRRWRGKPELVKAAVDGHVAGPVPSWADTGSLRGDLMKVMLAMRGHLTDEFLAMMSGLIHAMR